LGIVELVFVGGFDVGDLRLVNSPLPLLVIPDTFLRLFKLFKLFIWTLFRIKVIIFSVFKITEELLIGLSVLKILVLRHILFQFKLLLVFNFTNSLLVINFFLFLIHSNLLDPLVGGDLWHDAAPVLEGVKLGLANIVLRLVSNTHDKTNYLKGF
jgi:hypothetical protein